ncbi:MAG: GntR family transcriptional regulator [Victivallaceae bacterium]
MEKPYLRLVRQLETQIVVGQLRSGEKLPSLRSFAARTGLSLDMVRRAMRSLGEKGMVEARHGDGFYVASLRNSDGQTRIAVLFHFLSPAQGAEEGYFSAVALRGVQKEAEQSGVTLILHYANGRVVEHEPDRAVEILQSAHQDADAVVILGTFDINRPVLSARVPVVGVAMGENYGGLLSLISLDAISAARLAADFFHRAGICRVRLYGGESGDCRIRAHAFAETWDGETEWIHSEYPDDQTRAAALSEPDYPEGIGYWFSNGTLANAHAVRFKARHGVTFALARKVLSLDGKSLISLNYEPVNTITPDWELIGKLALREALRRIREPGSGALRIGAGVRLETVPAADCN